MEKYIKDGKVAVLYAAYAVGLPTWWNDGRQEVMFDADIVKLVLSRTDDDLDKNEAINSKIEKLSKKKFGKKFNGVAYAVGVKWVDEGKLFHIEHDGLAEFITLKKEVGWVKA